jgi:hypothetical protein
MVDSSRAPRAPSEVVAPRSITVRLILDDPDDTHVRGRVEVAGTQLEFSGWLSLMSHLERLVRPPSARRDGPAGEPRH